MHPVWRRSRGAAIATAIAVALLALSSVARARAGIMVGVNVTRPPVWPQPAAGPSASGDPEVVFTFDDGPHETYTAEILDELARRRIHAIFFWVGHRVEDTRRGYDKRRELVARAIREGHIVANHTVTHAHMCLVPEEQAAQEIDLNRHMYEALTGMPVMLFRTPYGARCARLEKLLADRGLGHFHWDIDPQEWKFHSAERTFQYVTKKLSKLRGRAVLLLHDTKKTTANALPRILDWIDAENVRRRAAGERPLRILAGEDVVAERLPAGLLGWLRDTSDAVREDVVATLSGVIP
jgi:peptidoglycan/xylan/chitin deacetylase (PgdA/CDA1 family)